MKTSEVFLKKAGKIMVGKNKVPPENYWRVTSLIHTAMSHLSYLDFINDWKQKDEQPNDPNH